MLVLALAVPGPGVFFVPGEAAARDEATTWRREERPSEPQQRPWPLWLLLLLPLLLLLVWLARLEGRSVMFPLSSMSCLAGEGCGGVGAWGNGV